MTRHPFLTKLRNPFAAYAGLVFLLLATLGSLRGGAYALIMIAGGVGAWALASLAERRFLRPDRNLLCGAAITLALMVVTDFFSVHAAVSWKETLRIASFLLPFLLWSSPQLLDRLATLRLWRFWPWLLLLGLAGAAFAMGGLRAAGDEARLAKYNRGVSYAFLLAWPAMALLRKEGNRRFFFLFLLALVPALLLTHSRAAQLGSVVGGAVALLVYLLPRAGGWLLSFGAVLLPLWPFGAQRVFDQHPDLISKLPDSWRARAEIWDYFSYRVLERPLLGHGVGGNALLPFAEPHGAAYVFTTFPAAHPHNMFVQLWVEMGALGVVLGLFAAFWALRLAVTSPKDIRPFACGAAASALVLALSAYDFWTDSLWACWAAVFVLFSVLKRRN